MFFLLFFLSVAPSTVYSRNVVNTKQKIQQNEYLRAAKFHGELS